MPELKKIFIVWVNSATNPVGSKRSFRLADKLDCHLVLIGSLVQSRNFVWRIISLFDYLVKSIRTMLILFLHRPDVCVAQSGPSFCPMSAFIYTSIMRKELIVDAHNGAFESPWINIPFYKYVLRRSKVTIVHNVEVASIILEKYPYINIEVLHDPLPEFKCRNIKSEDFGSPYLLVITTFSKDEPLDNILGAIKLFRKTNQSVRFLVTGDFTRNLSIYRQYSDVSGIEFLGFVEDDLYCSLLVNALATISLSTRPNVQQCAVVESVSAEVPFVASMTDTSRRLFGGAGVLVGNSCIEIHNGIVEVVEHNMNYRHIAKNVRENIYNQWNSQFEKILNIL